MSETSKQRNETGKVQNQYNISKQSSWYTQGKLETTDLFALFYILPFTIHYPSKHCFSFCW